MTTQIKIRIINKAGNRVAGARVAIFDGDTEIRSFVSTDGESSFEPDPEYAAHLLRVRVSKGKSAQDKTCRLEGDIVSLTFELEDEPGSPPPPPPPPIKRLLIPAGLVLLGLIVWLVWSLIPSQGGNPRVVFEASPVTIPGGGTSELTWTVADADTEEIVPGIGTVQSSGKSAVTLSQTTTYTLLAKNAAGETTAEVTVQVGGTPTPAGPRVISFTASPETIQSGAKSRLAWEVEGADSVEISPNVGRVRPSGQSAVAPSQTTTYTLVAQNPTGEIRAEVTVRVTARLKEDCLSFDPGNLRIQRRGSAWILTDGGHSIKSFPNQTEAEKAVSVIQHYRMNSICFVGRPDPSMEYWLVGSNAPRGAFPGEDSLPLNVSRLLVRQDGRQWLLTDGTQRIMLFPNKTEADLALAVIKNYGFTRICYIGRPQPSMVYLRQ